MALRILSTTKKPRDWMLSKQKQIPIRFCTAALHIATIGHEEDEEHMEFSKSEVATVVRFESSEKLTMEEFVSRIAEIGSNLPSNVESEELVCEHKKRVEHIAFVVCAGNAMMFSLTFLKVAA